MAGKGEPYRPLNVRDALSYLDQVKVQFAQQPEVYNKFLDVMKEFKSQTIDTPGVIDRVSTLFRGHPTLIQGFNTFLPPGYRIDCPANGESGVITVTTPTGTVSHVPGGFTAALQEERRLQSRRTAAAETAQKTTETSAGSPAPGAQPTPVPANPPSTASGILPSGTPAFRGTNPGQTGQSGTPRPAPVASTAAPVAVPLPPHPQQPKPASGPSTPSTAALLAAGLNQAPPVGGTRPGMEFNHAISFVNKIKVRFNNDAETYKQFLEILQTYQRDNRDITDVFAQVSKLFGHAPDLISEFKQFLPEINGGPLNNADNFGSVVQAAANEPSAALGQKRAPAKDAAQPPAGKKRRAPEPKGGASKKKGAKAESPEADDTDLPLLTPGTTAPQTLASPEEIAFFDKVKKHVDDKVTYHEFLKLINLFSQDMIDTRTLLERSEYFIGGAGDVWITFKKMIQVDDAGNPPPNPYSSQGGHGFGGMINVDGSAVDMIPMLERVKPDLNGLRVKTYGPSYRKLPKTEINLTCTGRDAMCWEVLNDEWVSHPTWAAEDAAPFLSHKKNAYEEALHKSEEERHEYDYHIEANLRTIAVLEPLNNKLQTMDPEERVRFNLRSGIGGQSKSIYQRILKKVYGKELGHDIVRAIHENPAVALPIVLDRLKAKDEEWKKAQREWNRVWREQDAKNFYKALDHQGVQFKQNDKRTITSKSLLSELELRRKEQTALRQAQLNPSAYRSRPQFELEFKDVEVLKDIIKLVLTYLDRVNNQLSVNDKERIERQLRDFVPLMWMLDKEAFDAEFGSAEHGDDDSAAEDSEEDGDGDVSMAEDDESSSAAGGSARRKKGGAAGGDLRKKLLKQAQEKERERGSTMTPGPEDETRSVEGTPNIEDRGESPVPTPDDPEAVAQAVEADKAGAEANEQTWVDIDVQSGQNGDAADGDDAMNGSGIANGNGSADHGAESGYDKRKLLSRGDFYANANFYVLVRLIELLYTRLLTCKNIADDLARNKKKPINPIAIRLGLAEPENDNGGVEAGENPAQYYYSHLLVLTEKLFENEIDVSKFEENLRVMFGTKAFILFTIDRVVAAIVKQLQTIVGDMKSQELFALLQRDRSSTTQSSREKLAYRHSAEMICGGGTDEEFYRIQTIPARDLVTIKLMTKFDPTNEDEETEAARWQGYVDSYVLTHSTEGLPQRVDEPLLKRNLSQVTDEPGSYQRKDGLSCRIALGTYRMFAVEGTEDYFHHGRKALPTPAESSSGAAMKRLEAFVEKKLEEDGGIPGAQTSAPAVAAV